MRQKLCCFVSCMLVFLLCLTGCTKEVENEACTVTFDGEEYEGVYTGTMEKDFPAEEGIFEAGDKGDEDYVKYKGTWKEGLADGKGKLISYDEDRERFTYTGDFKKGYFHGQGKMMYDNEEYYVQEGTFKKGEYTPNFVQFVSALGTYEKGCPYELSDEEIRFLKKEKEVFQKHTPVEDAKTFDLSEFKINPDKVAPKFTDFPELVAFQVYTEDAWGKELTTINAFDENLEVYTVYFLGDHNGIKEGSSVKICGLPIDYTSYESLDKDTIQTTLIFAAVAEKF